MIVIINVFFNGFPFPPWKLAPDTLFQSFPGCLGGNMIPAGGAAPTDQHSLSRLCVSVMPLMHTVLQLAVYLLCCLSAGDQSIKGSRL